MGGGVEVAGKFVEEPRDGPRGVGARRGAGVVGRFEPRGLGEDGGVAAAGRGEVEGGEEEGEAGGARAVGLVEAAAVAVEDEAARGRVGGAEDGDAPRRAVLVVLGLARLQGRAVDEAGRVDEEAPGGELDDVVPRLEARARAERRGERAVVDLFAERRAEAGEEPVQGGDVGAADGGVPLDLGVVVEEGEPPQEDRVVPVGEDDDARVASAQRVDLVVPELVLRVDDDDRSVAAAVDAAQVVGDDVDEVAAAPQLEERASEVRRRRVAVPVEEVRRLPEIVAGGEDRRVAINPEVIACTFGT